MAIHKRSLANLDDKFFDLDESLVERSSPESTIIPQTTGDTTALHRRPIVDLDADEKLFNLDEGLVQRSPESTIPQRIAGSTALIALFRFELQEQLDDVRSQLKHQKSLIDRLLSQEPPSSPRSWNSSSPQNFQLGKGKFDKGGKSDKGGSPKGGPSSPKGGSSPRSWQLDGSPKGGSSSPKGGSSPRSWHPEGSQKGGSSPRSWHPEGSQKGGSSPHNWHLGNGKGKFGKGKGKDKSDKGPSRDISNFSDFSQPKGPSRTTSDVSDFAKSKTAPNSLIPHKTPTQSHDHLHSNSLEVDCDDSRVVLATLKTRVPANALHAQAASDTDDILVDHWSFRNSYWDVAAFLGNKVVFELPEALANFLLLIVNIVVQVCFIVIVSNIATSSLTAETIEGYHKWRTNIGHELQYMDPLTEQSLAARVCSEDPSLHISETQSAQVQNIRGYLMENAPFNGPMMCTLAVLAWSLTVTREFHVLKDMVHACMIIPHGKTVIVSEGKRLELKSLSKYRFYFILALALLRSAIAGTLLIIGIRYLTVTISIEDILLNAVALEFVMNIDELLFEALAPNKTRRLILLMRPLPLPKRKQWRGLDADFVLLVPGLIVVLSLCLPVWLLQEMDSMRKAEAELCDGVQGFTFALTATNFVTWAESKLDPQETWNALKDTTRYRTLREIIEGRGYEYPYADNSYAPLGLTGIGWSVQEQNRWSIEDYGIEANGECRDFDDGLDSGGMRYVAIASLRDLIGDKSISSCRDVVGYCNDYGASVVRLFCPKSCACNEPHSALALPFPPNGCPKSCITSPDYMTVLNQLPCSDPPLNMLVVNQTWLDFMDNLMIAIQHWRQYRETYASAFQQIRQHGCAAVSIMMESNGPDLCAKAILKSLQVWCPISCQCSSRGVDTYNQCPTQCVN